MKRGLALFGIGLLVTLVVAVVIAQFASSQPDGLEYVAEQEGFLEATNDHALAEAPLADYGGESTSRLILSGVVGVLATLGLGYLVLSLARTGKTPAEE
ncbi:MAG TPA: PDGLE domain-containing protein [Acidimicrobiia bacterium]|nr:PDGLE domain-containing protein [Acidimicrobiia bacterium]